MSQARVLTCVYCGHEYPQDTPAWGNQVLTDHIAQCERHPMRAVIQDRDRLRSALEGLLGVSAVDELRQLAAITPRRMPEIIAACEALIQSREAQ